MSVTLCVCNVYVRVHLCTNVCVSVFACICACLCREEGGGGVCVCGGSDMHIFVLIHI